MKRGMIQLTLDQLLLLREQAASHELLAQKLLSASQTNGQLTTVELSENEVETLLDMLPHNERTQEMYTKLTTFLSQLRHP